MIEEFEYEGIWWLPDKPDGKVHGKLKFHPIEGLELELSGSFNELKDINIFLRPLIILGTTSNGKNITLYRCYQVISRLNIPSTSTSLFRAEMAFVGAHFQRPENIQFKSLSAYYSYLDEWVSVSGFRNKSASSDEVVIEYKKPGPFQAIIDNFKIILDFEPKYFQSNIPQKEVCIKQRAYIKIEPLPLEEISFDEYLNIMDCIQNFLSFGVTEPVYPLAIKGETELNRDVVKGVVFYPPIEIYYKLPEIPKKLIFSHNMLFTFKDISDKLENILKNWFEKAEVLKPVFDLYFGVMYSPRMYLEHQFLSITRALEAYHRRKFGGKYLSDEEYKPILEKLEDIIMNMNINESFKNSLKSKLRYGNEYSLIKRLRDLLTAHWDIFQDFIENRDCFIKFVVDTRNYLTHYDEKLKNVAARKDLLHDITQKLKTILQAYLIYELGFGIEEIKSMLAKTEKINNFL